MKRLLNGLVGLASLYIIVTLGLFVTGHLVIETQHSMPKTVIVDVGGIPFAQVQDGGTISKIVFVK